MSGSPSRLAALIATCGGIGLFPLAPGTLASFVALFPAWVIADLGGPVALALAGLVALGLGIWAAGAYSRDQGVADPSQVVVDEVAAVWLVLAFLPLDLGAYLAGFVAFRIFDIVKPWPVGWADRKVSGGAGIMLDDLLAGIYALLLALAVNHWARRWL